MSAPVPLFHGHVEDGGHLVLDDQPGFDRLRRRLAGQPVDVILRRRRTPRSNNENRYYWGVVVALLGEHFGYRRDEMHEALKFEFLRVDPDNEHPLATVRSTASLSTVEFEDFLSTIRQWAAEEYAIQIPLPNEVEVEA